MAYSCLPFWPLLLFGILEPAALIWAYIEVWRSPFGYFAGQAPNHPIAVHEFTPQAESLTFQLGNVLLLLCPVAIICCWTSNSRTTLLYLLAVALADYGHIYAAWRGVGTDYFLDLSKWNDVMWGNVGASAFLNVNRLLTVLGVFGKVSDSGTKKRKST